MLKLKRASLAAVFIAILLGPDGAIAQPIYEDKNEAGVVTSLTFVGGSEWLVAQEDPKSHWHRLP